MILTVAIMLMGIGYSAIESVTGEIEGKVIAEAQNGIFITDVEYVSDVDANRTSSKINNFLGTMMQSTVELSKTNQTSEIKYKVTAHNSSTETVPFVGVAYDDDFYDNTGITFEITQEGFQIGDKTGWTTLNVENSRIMFAGCQALTGGNGTTFDSNYTDGIYARIDTEEMPGYFTNIKDKFVDTE